MVESSDSTEQFREINISGGSTNYFGELAFYLCMVLFLKNSIVVCVYNIIKNIKCYVLSKKIVHIDHNDKDGKK